MSTWEFNESVESHEAFLPLRQLEATTCGLNSTVSNEVATFISSLFIVKLYIGALFLGSTNIEEFFGMLSLFYFTSIVFTLRNYSNSELVEQVVCKQWNMSYTFWNDALWTNSKIITVCTCLCRCMYSIYIDTYVNILHSMFVVF